MKILPAKKLRAKSNPYDIVLTSVRRRFNAMDVVWMSKRCRVVTGIVLKKNEEFAEKVIFDTDYQKNK